MSIVTQGYGDQGAIITQGYGAGIFEALEAVIVNLSLSLEKAKDTLSLEKARDTLSLEKAKITFSKVE